MFTKVDESKNKVWKAILTVCKAITPKEIFKSISEDSTLLQVICENKNSICK